MERKRHHDQFLMANAPFWSYIRSASASSVRPFPLYPFCVGRSAACRGSTLYELRMTSAQRKRYSVLSGLELLYLFRVYSNSLVVAFTRAAVSSSTLLETLRNRDTLDLY